MRIRVAAVVDEEGIAKLHVDGWRTTYKNILPNDFLDVLEKFQGMGIGKKLVKNFFKIIEVFEDTKSRFFLRGIRCRNK